MYLSVPLVQEVFCDMGRQNVFKQDLVYTPHCLHLLLLDLQLGFPKEIRPRGKLNLAVQHMEKCDHYGKKQHYHQLMGQPFEAIVPLGIVAVY